MQYKAGQVSYIDGRTVAVGEVFDPQPFRDPKTKKMTHHVPGPHWDPVDEEAKAHCTKLGVAYTGEVPDMVERVGDVMGGDRLDAKSLGEAIAGALAKMGTPAAVDHEALVKAIVAGVRETMPEPAPVPAVDHEALVKLVVAGVMAAQAAQVPQAVNAKG